MNFLLCIFNFLFSIDVVFLYFVIIFSNQRWNELNCGTLHSNDVNSKPKLQENHATIYSIVPCCSSSIESVGHIALQGTTETVTKVNLWQGNRLPRIVMCRSVRSSYRGNNALKLFEWSVILAEETFVGIRDFVSWIQSSQFEKLSLLPLLAISIKGTLPDLFLSSTHIVQRCHQERNFAGRKQMTHI